MSASIRLFPKFNPYELPVQWGKAYSSAAKAIARAKTLRAITVEVRDTNKPYSKGLITILQGGRDVAAPGA
jgi:hypothetical protein